MRFINLSLLTPANVVAVGAIIFFWGALAYFARNTIAGEPVASEE